MTLLIKYLICSSFILLTSGCLSKVDSILVDQTRTLDNDSGYLFLTIDSDVHYSNIRITGEKYLDLLTPSYYRGKNYYLIEVPAGNYKIAHFGEMWGGRYRFNRSADKELWSFNVNAGVISYIGELKVRKVRRHYSRFELVNNSSLALEYLNEKYPNILANRSLEYQGPGIDFFYQLVLGKKVLKIDNSEEN